MDPQPSPEPRFEALIEDLEKVVAGLESGDLSLEEALSSFEQGVRLAKRAESILNRAEARVEELLHDRDGGGPDPAPESE